ncbi:hypothetical protein C8Q80DRAFT_1269985 [Daedaleopsis nitida]|nr:hypothetical protein C8Q80DRAFT_1269985 [Daedaleopsis nitida]
MLRQYGLTFPLEIWREIFENVGHQRDRAALMRVCRSFRPEARAVLYKIVTLRSHSQARKFYFTVLQFPELASMTLVLTTSAVTMWEGVRMPTFLPVLFELLANVRRFSLEYFVSRPEEVCRPDRALHLNSRWFPRLKTFTTTLALSLEHGFNAFLREHPGIEEMYVGNAGYAAECNMPEFGLPVNLPALEVLSCTPSMLFDNLSYTRSITHLDLYRSTQDVLARTADLVGSQLVSLRLSRTEYTGKSWMLYDVITKFPNLRFLHVDMGVPPNLPASRPYVNLQPINWYEKINLYACDVPPRNLHVVWSYTQERNQEKYASSWRSFLVGTSLEVLTAWRPYVSIITFLHPALWRVSVSLTRDELNVRRRPEVAVDHSSWRYV